MVTIGIGVVMGAWLGTPTAPDNSEIVGRTSPTLIDLIVALAAGAAGAYAASNAKVADSLPGVAIAIALVPPLGTVGILLSYGDYGAASGAMLLFLTNFVSIVLAASVVFVLVGVVPIASIVQNAERTQGWFVSFAVAGILLMIPLAIGGQQAVRGRDRRAAGHDGRRGVAGTGARRSRSIRVGRRGCRRGRRRRTRSAAGSGDPRGDAGRQRSADRSSSIVVVTQRVTLPRPGRGQARRLAP